MIKHFLLVYNHEQGKLEEVIEFGKDSSAALKRYEELEAEHRHEPKMDIVLVGSDSLETIRITHRNYFDEARTWADLESYLRDVPTNLGRKR